MSRKIKHIRAYKKNLHKTVLKNSFGNLDKVMAIEAIEIEEEESKQSHFQKDVAQQQASASFYLLAVLFLFSYFTNTCKRNVWE